MEKRLIDFAANDYSGSAELAEQALNIIIDYCRACPAEDLENGLSEIIKSLSNGQPSMAAVINTAYRAEKMIRKFIVENRQGELDSRLKKLAESRKFEERRVIERTSSHLEKFKSIATYSRSSLVEKSIMLLSRNGFLPEIFVSESRPGNEGIKLAERLADAGFKVDICIDAALPVLIARSDVFIIGADAVAQDRFCNKIGTTSMCSVAEESGVPVLVVSTVEKLLPDELSEGLIIKERPPEELYNGENLNITVYNRLFEWCNNNLVTEFIFPDGLYRPDRLRENFKRLCDD